MPRETRDYAVAVDGKPAGTMRVLVTTGKENRQIATIQADVKVGHGIFGYTYSYRGSETWAADRIGALEANSNDNGKKTAVRAKIQSDRADVTVDGKLGANRPFTWTTSYWRLPRDEVRTGELAVLDVDNGTAFNGRLEFVGTEQLNFGGTSMTCSHYHLHAKVPVELWFDAKERLVRQTYVDDGHPTEIKLLRAAAE